VTFIHEGMCTRISFLGCKDVYCGSYLPIYLATRRHIQKTVFLAFVTTVDTVKMLQWKCKKQSHITMQKLKMLHLFDNQSYYGLERPRHIPERPIFDFINTNCRIFVSH
jgi:hypothetical protein